MPMETMKMSDASARICEVEGLRVDEFGAMLAELALRTHSAAAVRLVRQLGGAATLASQT